MGDLVIEVLGLAVHAHHGVREHEKARGQRFLIDLALVPSSSAGCESDRLEDTVSYSDAATLAVEIATGQRFDLIERLAAVIAEALLAQHPLERVTVRVHKPAAPIRNPFDDIVATVTRTRT
ncbi:MAG: dihydroneopterin aldolase / 2-amino-4-hydroxy-6-hydroxymethyldihydropteridine diphosphokinase [Gaiellales bacterium]|jgi:dihydroneopterin aldolase|nr:dihydroneopterin aldolase / 2-amino-4-hydroxy-6-hydroxymethyldihydropteridine diphosphokinase [Gaiellales bacterium]